MIIIILIEKIMSDFFYLIKNSCMIFFILLKKIMYDFFIKKKIIHESWKYLKKLKEYHTIFLSEYVKSSIRHYLKIYLTY